MLIAQTATSFDAAARFLTQAGFGPRPDLVQHVQAVGFSAFIAEQQAIPVESYSSADGSHFDHAKIGDRIEPSPPPGCMGSPNVSDARRNKSTGHKLSI